MSSTIVRMQSGTGPLLFLLFLLQFIRFGQTVATIATVAVPHRFKRDSLGLFSQGAGMDR